MRMTTIQLVVFESLYPGSIADLNQYVLGRTDSGVLVDDQGYQQWVEKWLKPDPQAKLSGMGIELIALAKQTFDQAENLIDSLASRGIGVLWGGGNRVDLDTFNTRKASCFGGESNNRCQNLAFSEKNQWFYCLACGCGDKKLARLTNGDTSTAPSYDEAYVKLHYPKLQCPLMRRGFSNSQET